MTIRQFLQELKSAFSIGAEGTALSARYPSAESSDPHTITSSPSLTAERTESLMCSCYACHATRSRLAPTLPRRQ